MDTSDANLLQVQAQVDLILAMRGLGQAPTLERLLRFLLTRSLEGHAPKEAEIAEAVWGRLPRSRDEDASVRVYIHRLRQRLDAFYAGPGREQAWRLVLPKGRYLLEVEKICGDKHCNVAGTMPDEVLGEGHAGQAVYKRRLWRRVKLASVVLCAAMGGWVVGEWHRDPGQIEVAQASALWQPLLDGEHRVVLVLGDYYIFGERDDQGNISRLIREFDVNSAGDLDDLKTMNAARARHYTDLDLAYLPVGVGAALRSVAPVLRAGRAGAAVVQVVTSSHLSVQAVQNTSLVYLGYLSGLGILRSPLFDQSRFAIGSSFDEIIDRTTGRHYLASSHLKASDMPGEDYALVSSFKGVTGNRIIIIAGTRDAALMQAAEFVTRPATLARFDSLAHGEQSFEALLGISALRNIGLEARLINLSARPNPSWRKSSESEFPDAMPPPLRPPGKQAP